MHSGESFFTELTSRLAAGVALREKTVVNHHSRSQYQPPGLKAGHSLGLVVTRPAPCTREVEP